MSAACAADAAPNITAASKNPRIATLPSNTPTCGDHRPLTLTNRCRRPVIGAISSENEHPFCAGAALSIVTAQNKTAREDPAPLRTIKKSKARSAFADQRRRVDRRAAQVPTHAELEVMRSDILERRRVEAVGTAAIES